MAHDEFDVYDTIIRSTIEQSSLRRQLDGLYSTLITFVLTGEAYLAFYSYSHSLDNWVIAGAAGAMSLVGLMITSTWYRGQRNLTRILRIRYEFLRELEHTDTLQKLGATVFTDEWKTFYESRYDRRPTVGLQFIFTLIFIFIPLAFSIANLSSPIAALLNSLHL